MTDCIFCKIINGKMEAKIVGEDEIALAFRDINPQAPTHILIIPKKHIESLDDASSDDQELLGHLLIMAQTLARAENIVPGYRVVLNNGRRAGQSVFHVHAHLLGGRDFRWPPG